MVQEKMNFKLEGFMSKLKSPVIVVIDETAEEYEPEVLAKKSFPKRYEIESILAKDNKLVLRLVEKTIDAPRNYIGEEAQL